MLGAFIPYQVILYPLVKILRFVGLYSTLPGIIVIQHHLRTAAHDHAVSQFLRGGAGGSWSRRRGSTAPGSFGFLRDHAAMIDQTS